MYLHLVYTGRMKRVARSYASLIALGVVLVAAAVCWRFPAVLSVMHHYANFIAVGRSSVKLVVLGIFALLVFGASLVKPLWSSELLKKYFLRTVYVVVGLTMLSTLCMGVLIENFHVPGYTTFYAVTDTEFSFGHLTHSHLYRPISYFMSAFSDDVGTAWYYTAKDFLGIPSWILIPFYIVIGLIEAWFIIISIAFISAQKGIARKLLYLVATMAVIKSLVDGAFFDMGALIGLTTLGVLTKKKFLAILPLPFLLVDYFMWFTPGFLHEAAITVSLMIGLGLLVHTEKQIGYRRAGLIVSAGICFGIFLYGGALVSFFGTNVKQELNTLATSDTNVIPANAVVYYLPHGSLLPSHATTTATTSVETFVNEHAVDYDNFRDSIKIDGVNCKSANQRPILNRVKIFNPSNITSSSMVIDPWIYGETDKQGYTSLSINSCLPNPIPSLVRNVKTLFPDEVIVFAFLR